MTPRKPGLDRRTLFGILIGILSGCSTLPPPSQSDLSHSKAPLSLVEKSAAEPNSPSKLTHLSEFTLEDISSGRPSWKLTDATAPPSLGGRTYQNALTGSTISFNSACRTQELSHQPSEVVPVGSDPFQAVIQQMRAAWQWSEPPSEEFLPSAASSKSDIRGVAIKNQMKIWVHSHIQFEKDCLYRFLFVSLPQFQSRDGSVFRRFVESFKVSHRVETSE